MLGLPLIGCQEDSKYFHTHKETHRTNTSWFNWSNWLPWSINQVTRTNKHWRDVKSDALIRICQVCVKENHKSASIGTAAVSVVLNTSGQLKHGEQRLSTPPQSFHCYCKVLWDKLLCCYSKSCRVLMEYLWSMCCAGKRASCPELPFWKNSRDEKNGADHQWLPSEF